ncbi:MAG: hypothetical protein A2Y62_10385 [Candidatus Fischerbacteria bacterium RBG_13_37_8]|uniref:Uncharacterized protein n=1 Tax=Candidatus Fischerbacteria bacterium RBG_13_37_8 TaxID=1817863 RepID=A0A1F5VRP2_9BACT|nr:MAG: hypothetical protein A2Y62_10385 [Candidatus Fischerbacteria bacterium RBG_13_37_8]
MHGNKWQSNKPCHHIYRWLTLRGNFRPERLFELGHGIQILADAINNERFQEEMKRIFKNVISFSPKEYFAFFPYVFEALLLSRLIV